MSQESLNLVKNTTHERHDSNNNIASIAATSSGIADDSSSVGVSNSGNLNFLVSEHEDNEGEECEDDRTQNNTIPTVSTKSNFPLSKSGVHGVHTTSSSSTPAEIPPEPADHDRYACASVQSNVHASDDESEYSYDYEDDDECHISGFLIPDPHPTEPQSTTRIPQDPPGESDSTNANEHSNRTKELSSTISTTSTSHKDSSTNTDTSDSNAKSSLPLSSVVASTADPEASARKSAWKEPSQAAVSMSLRAEREKTGGKRRLASDLYKIMMNDTEDAGFSLEPASEDSMEKWKIKLFKFDTDSNLHKDLMALGLTHVELEMSFPEQYPFEPPFVRVVKPRFKRQTGFVMNGAICSELLTNEGWNPVNDIESVIVSIRSLLVVGNGRLAAAVDLPERKRMGDSHLRKNNDDETDSDFDGEVDDDDTDDDKNNKIKSNGHDDASSDGKKRKSNSSDRDTKKKKPSAAVGQYSAAEARAAYNHLTDYHKKKGWDSSGWWARKG